MANSVTTYNKEINTVSTRQYIEWGVGQLFTPFQNSQFNLRNLTLYTFVRVVTLSITLFPTLWEVLTQSQKWLAFKINYYVSTYICCKVLLKAFFSCLLRDTTTLLTSLSMSLIVGTNEWQTPAMDILNRFFFCRLWPKSKMVSSFLSFEQCQEKEAWPRFQNQEIFWRLQSGIRRNNV